MSGGALGKLLEKAGKNKKWRIAVYGGLLLLILLLCFGGRTKETEKAAAASANLETVSVGQSEREVEKRLEGILSSIRGAGQVRVMITYETGVEVVTAMSTDKNSNRSESSDMSRSSLTVQQTESTKPATVSGGGGNEPIILGQKQPVIRGVIVVAEGAADISVRVNLQQAVQTVLAVPANSVEVFELSKKYKNEEG